MQRSRPAQRRSKPKSVVKKKQRRALPTRASRTTASKSLKSSWFSKRKKQPRSTGTTRSSSQSTWWQTLVVWIVLLVLGSWVTWHLVIWGIMPKLLAVRENKTVALLPTSAGGDVVVAQLEPELKESTVFLLNGEETVALPGEYGEYRLSAIYPLLLIDEKDERYFRGALNRVFGVFLDNTVLVSAPLEGSATELKAQLLSDFWFSLTSAKNPELDLLRTWYVLSYRDTIVDTLSVQALVDSIRSLNGGTFATRDECRVAILNSTTTPGLAGGLADIVERNGGIVIRLGQYSETLEKSTLLYDPAVAECQEALAQIETLSPVPFERVEDTTVQGRFRAPVVAIIGQNFE